jgi:phosphoglycerol transferase MdoB-like AlkP superfamily enzyme
MLSKIKFAFYYWLIWIGIFEIARIAFILFNFGETKKAGFFSVSKSMLYGIRMDAAMATYILLPVCLFLLVGIFVSFFANRKLYQIYTSIISITVLLIILCDLPAFNTWGYRLDATPLKYLLTPNEAWASVSNLPVFWYVAGFVVIYLIILKLFSRFITYQQVLLTCNKNKWMQLLLMLFFSAAQIIPMRGGWQLAPINQSTVYYSTDNFSNLSAINVTWNFFNSLSHDLESSVNPFIYMDDKTAKAAIANLYSDGGITTSLIDTTIQNPNIILIVWESFTKKVVDSMHNGIVVTPGFNQLKKEGVYFSDVYGTGDRTDKGIVGILSGYPSQPTTSIVKVPQKAAKLPKLPKTFVNKNYQASFYYGGELELANMKSYLSGSGFNNYTQKSDFDTKDQNSKWGAHDGVVKNKIISDFNKIKQPFFTTWLTLSSHEPYDTPIPTVINGTDDESQFTNSVHYADAMVTEFVNECKKQPFWKNTIMIIIADHGHRLPRLKNKIEDFKIPMLWLGGAVAQKGIEINKTCSQIDLAATLLAQLKKDNKAFTWSKNIMSNQTKPWAYFSFNNGFGYIEPKNYFIFDNVGKSIMEENEKHDNILYQRGKAFVQMSFGDYLGR